MPLRSELENNGDRAQVRCSACGRLSESPNEAFLIRCGRGLRTWKRCLSCQAYFLVDPYVPRSEVVRTEMTAYGREDTGTELNGVKKRMFLSVLHLLSRYCPPPATVLDIGCSYGGFLTEAAKAGYKVRGFDIVPRAVEYVKALGIPAEVCFSISEVDAIEDASLDIITCLDCHYYWPDQAGELRQAYAKLKPGGYLAMRVVDKSWMFSIGLLFRRLSKAAGEKFIRAAVNDHRFSMPLPSLLEVIKASGFDVIYASPRGAIQSDRTRLPVKLSFALGTLLWEAKTGIFLAPGALVLATKHR